MSGYSLSGTAAPGSDLTIDGPSGMSIEVTTDENGKWATVLDSFKSGGGQKAAGRSGSTLSRIHTLRPGHRERGR